MPPCSPYPRRAAAAPRTFAILWRRRYPWSKESQGPLVPVVVGLPLGMPDPGVFGGSTTAPLTGRGLGRLVKAFPVGIAGAHNRFSHSSISVPYDKHSLLGPIRLLDFEGCRAYPGEVQLPCGLTFWARTCRPHPARDRKQTVLRSCAEPLLSICILVFGVQFIVACTICKAAF